jgi:AcrR family transcriptional regulator
VTADLGLRERKKLATRAALRAAALRLASDRGVDAVTAEDIAADAGVSTRTFFNYFATKEEAFVADDLERGRRLVAVVAETPDGVPLWPLLRRAAGAALLETDLPDREQALKEQLVRASPTVMAAAHAGFARLEQQLVQELDRRTGRASGLRARLLATAALAAVRAAVETWLADDGEFADLLDEAFDALAPAFPDG